jgi:hypothetical protein
VRVVGLEVAEGEPRRREAAGEVVERFEEDDEIRLEPPDLHFVRDEVVGARVPGGAGVLHFDADLGMTRLQRRLQ